VAQPLVFSLVFSLIFTSEVPIWLRRSIIFRPPVPIPPPPDALRWYRATPDSLTFNSVTLNTVYCREQITAVECRSRGSPGLPTYACASAPALLQFQSDVCWPWRRAAENENSNGRIAMSDIARTGSTRRALLKASAAIALPFAGKAFAQGARAPTKVLDFNTYAHPPNPDHQRQPAFY